MNGLLILNKPSGMTSREAIDRVGKPWKRAGIKYGHAGTLDPLANGVLVVAIGSATRLIEYVQRMQKVYRTTLRLGARSDTLDADGTITPTPDPKVPEASAVGEAVAAQVGTILQVPPQYSALKVEGRRAYDLIRSGHSVELTARPVRVDRIDILNYVWPHLELEIACGGGTYIRSIGRDIGEELACGALVEVLTRTRIGPFRIEDAIDPDDLDPASLESRLRPAIEALADLPRVALSPGDVARISRGAAVPIPREARSIAGEAALLDTDGNLLALARIAPERGAILPTKVLTGG